MKKEKKKFRWGIIGAGKIARKFTLGLSYLKDAERYAVASRSLEKAKIFAEENGVQKAFGSYKEMLEDETLDVVYVATPHVFHQEHSLLCMRHRKAVLCEKPFAINKKQVQKMIQTSKEENVFLMEAMWTRFLPHYRYVTDLLQQGRLGRIRNLKADFGFAAPYDEQGRLFNRSLGGGSLLDIGIYPIFLALDTMGLPENIVAKAHMGTTGVDEACDVIFRYKNGVRAELGSSILAHTPTTAVFEMEQGSIKIHSRFHEPSSVEVSTDNGKELKEFEVAPYGYQYEAEHVQEMLQQQRTESDEMTFDKSLQLIGLLDRIRNQIRLEY